MKHILFNGRRLGGLIVYRIFSFLKGGYNVPRSDRISETFKDLNQQSKQISGIGPLSQDWHSYPGTTYILETSAALHGVQSDTRGEIIFPG